MSKRQKFFGRVAEFKDRFRSLSTEQLRDRLMSAPVTKEAAIAYREVLEERGSSVDESAADSLIIKEDRPLSPAEGAMLRWLLSRADSRGRSFLPQVESARVVSRCGCGCASVDLSVAGVEPRAGVALEQISHDYYWNTPSGGLCGVFVFAKDDQLAGLEVWSVDGAETATVLPTPDQLRSETWEQA